MKKYTLIITVLIILAPGAVCAQQKIPVVNNGISRPKLVVGLVIDQMRWDYLYRYQHRYGNGGFKRLLQKGYSFENCYVPYTPAVTAAGHASLYTGSVPSIHGIVGNDWVERDSAYNMYCTQDRSVRSIGTNSRLGEMSPRNLLSTTIGDELRLATNFKSRVFGIAMKDRGGILPAGHSANAAYWFDDSTGNWISSSYYMQDLPVWVHRFNKGRRVDSLMTDWNPLYDIASYDQSAPDDDTSELPLKHETTITFPHRFNPIGKGKYYPFRESPSGNSFTFDFAEALIRNEQLGRSGQADMLCVSLSSTDYIGHRVGTNSPEIEDVYLRLDKDIERFLDFLDAIVGPGNYLLFLSADHGAPQAPAFMIKNKLPSGSLLKAKIKDELNEHCRNKFGVNDLVKVIHEYQVYLDNGKIDSLKLDTKAIKEAIINTLLKKTEVVAAFDYAAFDNVVLPARIKEMFAKSYCYKRSGDIQYILKPQYNDKEHRGTEHGVMYSYDTHIPLVWYGWKVSPGYTNREVYMTDVAPTIAAKLKIQVPSGSIGKVLEEVAR